MWSISRFLLPALIAGVVMASPGLASCPVPVSPPPTDRDWDELEDELSGYGDLEEAGFTIGAQKVFRLRPAGDAGARDRLLDRLAALNPRITELQGVLDSAPQRDVLLIESRTDTFGDSMAFTTCAETDTSLWLEGVFDRLAPLPAGACAIVVFPDRIENARETDFVLAHEWMHTMQVDAYGHAADGTSWWREGAADWFGHKMVRGTTERDDTIDDFFEHQPSCELPEHSYGAQVFYFWAESEFDSRWVFEQGLEGEDWLRETGRVAQTLPPARWLDWAVAQADQAITMPDGRPLPAQVEAPVLDLASECSARIEGPPLSVQVREINLPGTLDGPVRIAAGDAQVAIREGGGDWSRFTGDVDIDPPLSSPLILAAISPSATSLSISLSIGDATPDGGCACYVGSWMELRGDNPRRPFRFGSNAGGIFAQLPNADITYNYPGPILTLHKDGRLTADRPHVVTTPDVRVANMVWQTYGTWTAENGALSFDFEARRFTSVINYGDISTTRRDEDRTTLAVGGEWLPRCEEGGLTLARKMFLPDEPPDKIYRFVHAP